MVILDPLFGAHASLLYTDNMFRMYYQCSLDRLPTCVVTIHTLLHITDSIEASGPMWAYWAFPMEHYCSSLIPAIRSQQFPFPSIDQYIMEVAQLMQVKMYHWLHDVLALQPPKPDMLVCSQIKPVGTHSGNNKQMFWHCISRSCLCMASSL